VPRHPVMVLQAHLHGMIDELAEGDLLTGTGTCITGRDSPAGTRPGPRGPVDQLTRPADVAAGPAGALDLHATYIVAAHIAGAATAARRTDLQAPGHGREAVTIRDLSVIRNRYGQLRGD
jgi:hypothetical protein